ncbi:MAG: hypothetical protein PHU27_03270 [Salinivirgaceae bacterium]|nr:hypothetical protein [Salinivirgaceae bacterium]MDD4746380.1 hypothetical protein [Salinivirgaceae bacterium]
MDLGSSIITAIFLAICIVPFILMGRSRKKRKKETLQSLSKIANQHNCNISKHEIHPNFIIGMDESKKFVFFVKKTDDKVTEQYINLAEIQSCKVKTTGRTIEHNNGTQNLINKLELSFIALDKNKKETTLELFNADTTIQLSGELQIAEQWSKQINDLIKNKS